MQPSEAALLLAKVAAFDRRTVGEVDAQAWADVLTAADVTLPDALDAVSAHFAASSDWLMPGHIIGRVRAVHAGRIRAAGLPDMPPGLDQVSERAWARVWRREVAAGASAVEAGVVADARYRVVRPQLLPRPVQQLIGARDEARPECG